MSYDNQRLSRRTFLGTGACALSIGLAGCAGVGSNSNGTSGGGGEKTLDFVGGRQPTQIQFNKWNLANFGHTYSTYFTTPIATAYSDGAIQSAFLEELTADGQTLTMTFPTGWKYWNGKEVKARDYYIGAEINRLQDPKKSNYTSHTVDGNTLKRTFKHEVTPTLMKASVVGTYVDTPRWIFEDYLKRYQNASGTAERDTITQELLKMTIPTKQFVEEGLGNGLYEITQFNSAETLTEKFDDHQYADRTDVNKTRIIPVGEKTDSLATSDKLDMTPFGYITQSKRYPDNIENQFKLSWFRTQKFILNWKNEHLAKRPVRRAILSAIDLKSITAAAVQAKYIAEPTQVQTGLRSSIHEEYLGKEFVDKLIKYPVEGDTETASQYMKQAGYSKKKGVWTSPEGKKVNLKILTRSNIGQAQPTKVLSDQLNSFGIETTLNAVGDNYYTKLQEWNFDLGWVWHVAKALWHPTAYYSNDFYGVLVGDPSSNKKRGPTGVPFSLKIPKKVGAKERQGSGAEVRPAQLMNDLPASPSKEEVKKRTRTLVQWFNYDLPDIVYMQENSGYWGDEANFSFPDGSKKKINANNPGQLVWTRGWVSKQ
jgi:peptide/nickel transport system substrate-binding protein